jgi:magnesium transporter
MTTDRTILPAEVPTLLADQDPRALRDFCASGHPAAVAEALAPLGATGAWEVLRHAEAPLRAEIFSHLEGDLQFAIIGTLRRGDIAGLLTAMPHDERADLFKRLPAERRASVLPALAQAEREDIRRLIAHAEGTAGAVMTSDYATLPPHLTAAQAIDRLREVAPDRETIYYAYVVDENRRLMGFVSLKDLILAGREERVADIMHTEMFTVRVDDDQEQAARQIQKYDLLALPVLDGRDALVGIITHDDAMDIMTQEHTEDMEKFMAIAGRHEEAVYLKTPVWGHFRNRYPWLVGLALLGLVSGVIVQNFSDLLMRFTVLAAFMPMLADTGGNTGSQAATLVVRALALKEVSTKDIARILSKEFGVALLLALLLGAIAFARVIGFGGGDMLPQGGASLLRIACAISLALGLQVVTSTLVGALLPLGAARMHWDPAVVASPALTTIVDITGLLIYFTTARLILGI